MIKDQIPEFAVGWGTLALINAGLAQAKNRSGLVWFFVSLFLGPLATLIIVVLDKAEPPETSERRRKRFNLQDFRQQ
jgi:hypothetical protein